MVTVLSGVALLVATLAVFSLFSLKMPKGSLAMSGMADAAVATFLVEAIHSYISGDLFGISFLKQVGTTSGSMGGVAAAIMVPICMGANPLYGVVAGVAVAGYGILPGFIAGYIVGCSDRFSVCLSVLNRNFRTSGKIKGGDYFGSVYWDGTSYRHLTLSEIPKYAQIHAGDTIVTTAHSSIFPPDLTIGTVESFELNNATYYDVKVRLHTDIAALNNVLAVRYIDADERGALEQSVVAPEAE